MTTNDGSRAKGTITAAPGAGSGVGTNRRHRLLRFARIAAVAFSIAVSALVGSRAVAGAAPSDHGIDYLDPGDLPQESRVGLADESTTPSTTSSLAAAASDGDLVTYTSFAGVAHSLRRVSGKYTFLLMTDAALARATLGGARELVDRFDLLYAHLRELIGAEPAGNGLLSIAFVPTCGGGCGYLGVKGIELDPGTLDPTSAFGADAAYRYGVHEMTHNYDLYSRYFMYGPDAGHSWTDFMNNYIEVYDRGGIDGLSPAEVMRRALGVVYLPYVRFPGRTWERCVRDDACDPARELGQHAVGGVALRIADAHRPTTATKAMRRIRGAIAARSLVPAAMSVLEKNDLLVEALSFGAGKDLSCFFDQLAWPVSPQLRQTLDQRFPSNPSCRDADGDGFTAYRGDCNDADATIGPEANEVANGRDDDCNGTIDDVTVEERGDFPGTRSGALVVRAPARLHGTIVSANDSDTFAIELREPATVTFTIESMSDFAGWLFLYDGGGWREYGYAGAGGRATFAETLPAGRWEFAVQLNVNSHPGAYRASVELATPWLRTFTLPGAGRNVDGSFTLVAPPLASLPISVKATKVRFWVSGVGFVGKARVGSRTESATLRWTPPAGFDASTARYRVQFLKGRTPTTPVSAAAPLGHLS